MSAVIRWLRQGSKEKWRGGGGYCGDSVTGEESGRRKEMTTWPGRQGPHVGEGERNRIPIRDLGLAGRGPFRVLGRTVPFGPFIFFPFLFLFLFCFLDYFITFSNLNQIDSNQLCKVSKIQTTFQNSNKHVFIIKTNFQLKLYILAKGLICMNQSRNRILK
jgi:hypothetical protein